MGKTYAERFDDVEPYRGIRIVRDKTGRFRKFHVFDNRDGRKLPFQFDTIPDVEKYIDECLDEFDGYMSPPGKPGRFPL